MKPRYSRVLLKISGESLIGKQEFGIDPAVVERIARDVLSVVEMGVSVGLVVGGGNLFRGVSMAARGGDRVTGDHLGMLATVMNGLAIRAAVEKCGAAVRLMSSITMPAICETYTYEAAHRHFESKNIVIFVSGTGNPYFTTDTAAALKAAEMGCDALFKGTKVDGIYDKDPEEFTNAVKREKISYSEVIKRDLRIMDTSALALARDNSIPIVVFSIMKAGQFKKALVDGLDCSEVGFF